VQEEFDGRGLVRAFGELWQAESRAPLSKGAQVRIVAIKGLVLTVERQE
jgi:membrane-bound serine protease (ClpP class)